MYTLGRAAELLQLDPGVLRKRAERGGPGTLGPREGANPLRDWLIDAGYVDELAGRTESGGAVWVEEAEACPTAGSREPNSSEQGDPSAERLLNEYRDQLEMLSTEVAIERERRLLSERRAAEVERDAALDEVRRLRVAVRALVDKAEAD